MTRLSKFNYVGPYNRTGYGIASSYYINNLVEINKDIATKIISNPDSALSDAVKESCNKIDVEAPVFRFWHLFDIPNQISEFKGKKVGYTTFELDSLTTHDIAAGKQLDYIGTASKWGKEVLEKYFPSEKVFVINHAFNDKPVNLIDFNVSGADRSKKIYNAWTK